MRTIWRFDFPVTDRFTLSMPLPARILPHVEANGMDRLTVWAEVEPGAEVVTRNLAVVGTGNPMPSALVEYVDTVSAPPFVWHVFEVTS